MHVLDPQADRQAADPGGCPADVEWRDIGDPLAVRLALLHRLRRPAVTGFTSRVREIVLIASSSRGGSSMLAETLRGSPYLLQRSAESRSRWTAGSGPVRGTTAGAGATRRV